MKIKRTKSKKKKKQEDNLLGFYTKFNFEKQKDIETSKKKIREKQKVNKIRKKTRR
uniref:Uncharacterized protein n=1 Tax=Siphoviridae sp. ctINK4 TaxID=2825428 RepID=A0A8S5NWN5_9CAUD|nr:MAG TPA: hypothetical protein [Siphoviridae sp. ctINK4]